METIIYIFWLEGSANIVQIKSSDFQNMKHAICTLPSEETIYRDWLYAMNSSNNVYTATPAMKQVPIRVNCKGGKRSDGLVFLVIAFHAISCAWK